MSNEENVIKFYVFCNRLKHLIRKGWLDWGVNTDRLESVAEHIYSTQMLAISMYKEYNYDIDIYKVLFMLAIHEVGEAAKDVGDKPLFDMTREEREKSERDAVHQIMSFFNYNDIEELFLEFDKHETKEAIFAYECDKLECDLQSKLYGENNLVDLNNQENNKIMDNELVKSLLDEGNTWEEMWLKFGQKKYPYYDNFRKVSNYALTHKINDLTIKNM